MKFIFISSSICSLFKERQHEDQIGHAATQAVPSLGTEVKKGTEGGRKTSHGGP